MKYLTGVLVALLVSPIALPANAAIRINEILMNPPGSDTGREYFELISTTGGIEPLAGLSLLVIEGDIEIDSATQLSTGEEGSIDDVIDLSDFSTGANGLFFSREGGLTGENPTDPIAFDPMPAMETVVDVRDASRFDFENDNSTYLLVSGFTGLSGDNLDTDNDGFFDITPWDSVLDAISIQSKDEPGLEYATQVGGQAFPKFTAEDFSPDIVLRSASNGVWIGADIVGDSQGGPFILAPTELANVSGDVLTFDDFVEDIPGWSPGNANPSLIGGASELLGDFNDDQIVDAADYTVWRDALASAGTLDNDGDTGIADAGDYDDWKNNFGATSFTTVSAGAVPEPASAALLGLAIVSAFSLNRRRQV